MTEQYIADLKDFMARYEDGTLTMESALRGLCKFSWLNLDGFDDPEFTGLVVRVEDVLEILNEYGVEHG